MIHLSGMHAAGPKNPLHGITLEKMVTDLQAYYGWDMLGRMIKINSFNWQPSIKSSLTFLRKTPWARQKVEELYVDTLPDLKAAAEGRAVAPSQWRDEEVPEETAPVTETKVEVSAREAAAEAGGENVTTPVAKDAPPQA
ncbi:uncharacterized protein (DUF2132 family) [Prosthecobacter dejongeii]|uniref:Uncharacterized protein (DUF2132 family) n=1 Tax=Prosthecobacter dejongeii TaxID=48465 RepID=A0A7W7YIP1_9BACT|nr:VF530 family protein [Prosthecobacter dejongeii]MBB5036955.1 uncharacterized protein (DUF2132 family) [Prosthecobacter dejongeii]